MTTNDDLRIVSFADAAARLGLTVSGLRDRMYRGVGPRVTRRKGTRPVFTVRDLDAYIEQMRTPAEEQA
jgi:hypothetical protein